MRKDEFPIVHKLVNDSINKVLDKIRAEIEQKCCITVRSENEPAITLYDVFKIIDKYKAGEEE